MTGNDPCNITLTLPQWRECYRILKNDHHWQSHLKAIEESCRSNQLTIQFPLAMTWPMSSTVRQMSEELAEEISRQMNANLYTEVW